MDRKGRLSSPTRTRLSCCVRGEHKKNGAAARYSMSTPRSRFGHVRRQHRSDGGLGTAVAVAWLAFADRALAGSRSFRVRVSREFELCDRLVDVLSEQQRARDRYGDLFRCELTFCHRLRLVWQQLAHQQDRPRLKSSPAHSLISSARSKHAKRQYRACIKARGRRRG